MQMDANSLDHNEDVEPIEDFAVLRYITSDEELEAAAQEIVMSYTYQTSASRRCCR